MWNIEFPMAKINEFPHHNVRTMHEIKMGIEFDAEAEKECNAYRMCVRVCYSTSITPYYSIGARAATGTASDTLFMQCIHSKNHTLSIYSHVFLSEHSNLFVESGI